jgi:hypothetical protein
MWYSKQNTKQKREPGLRKSNYVKILLAEKTTTNKQKKKHKYGMITKLSGQQANAF